MLRKNDHNCIEGLWQTKKMKRLLTQRQNINKVKIIETENSDIEIEIQ